MSTGKKPSIVWQYFIALPDVEKAKCNLCGSYLTYKNSTSSLRNHLSFKHPAINLNKVTFPSSLEVLSAIPSPSLPKQEPTDDLYVESCEWDSLTNSLVELCATDLLPLSVINGTGFKSFCQKLDPNCLIPSSTTITSQLLSYYSTVKDALISSLKGHSKLSFSVEKWSHSNRCDYSTISVHFIDCDWIPKSRVLCTYMDTDHESSLKYRFLSVMDKFDISNNSILAVSSSDCADIGFPVFKCIGSAFEHSVQAGLELPFISEIVQAGSKLQSHLEQNSYAADIFVNKQRQLKIPQKELIKNVPHRWKSTYKMFQRMLEQRLAILSIINDRGIIDISNARKYEVSEEGWSLLEDVCRVLEPFYAAVTVMETDKFPSASTVYPVITGLIQIHLKVKATDSTETRQFKQCISSRLKEYYYSYSDIELVSQPAIISSAVDPKFKQLRFLSEKQRSEVWDYVIGRLVVIKRSDLRDRKRTMGSTSEMEASELNPNKRAKTMEYILGDFYDLSDTASELESRSEDPIELSLPSATDVKEDALEEIERFKSEIVSVDLKSSYDWWKAHHRRYPLLSRLALQYLSIPATSTPSERIFSESNDILTNRRATLEPEALDQILFVRDTM